MIFIDTNIAIAFRDGDVTTQDRLLQYEQMPVISVITRIELENGVFRHAPEVARRRFLLTRFLANIPVQMFSEADVLAYGGIVEKLGHDRRKTLDRLIAAQAITRDALLITRNGRDFRDIERLKLEVW